MIFSVVVSFVNLFMNVFLWNTGMSFRHIGIFNMFSVTSIFLASLAGAYLLQRFGSRATFVLSSLLALVLFGYLFQTSQTLSSLLPFLGILYGSYVGLFYIGFNLHLLWSAGERNRAYLLGIESAITTAAQLLTPLSAGFFIVHYGYDHTFLVIGGLLLLQLSFSSVMPGLKMEGGYRKRFFFLAENEVMANIGFSSAAYGFYFSFVQMSFGLFLYLIVKSEFDLGSWNLLFGGISAFMFWLVGRVLKQSNYEVLLSMGMIASVIVTLTLLLSAPHWFILFNLVISASLPLLWLPAKSTHYAQMKRGSKKHIGKLMQNLVFREFSISLGRVVFFLIMIFGLDLKLGNTYYFMIILAVFMPIGIWILSKEKNFI
jgi:YQGE family putative transporter